MDPLILISADGHAGAPVEHYRSYLDPKYRHLMPELVEDEKDHVGLKKIFGFLEDPQRLAAVDDRNRIRTGGLNGSWDGARRLEELDAEGIAAEVILPGTQEGMTPFFYQFNRPYSDDVRMAGIRAYHRWLIDMIGPHTDRLIGGADGGPLKNVAEAIDELSFVARHGFKAVLVPGSVPDPVAPLPPLYDRHFEPFWSACADLGLVLTVHAGYGTPQGDFQKTLAELKTIMARDAANGQSRGFEEVFREVYALFDETNPESVFAIDILPQRILWQVLFSGVFDRHPTLKLTATEVRADWVPGLKARLDERFLTSSKRPKLAMKPSEYFGRNIFVTPSSPRRHEVIRRHEIGVKNFLFGADFPHPESTWPNTLAWLRAVFHDVAEDELRAVLGENAIHVYGLDKEKMSDIAAKIGLEPGDIIGDYKIDERVIADWDMRSNFNKEAAIFGTELMQGMLDSDIAGAAA